MPCKTTFTHAVSLVPMRIDNGYRNNLTKQLNDIPWLLYDVEDISDGRKIVINKPGGKRSFGKLSENDFQVFILNPQTNELSLPTHEHVKSAIAKLYKERPIEGIKIIISLGRVCKGEEPDAILQNEDNVIIDDFYTLEIVLKMYKWIFGQEDCNYPNGEGRWLTMRELSNALSEGEENNEK